MTNNQIPFEKQPGIPENPDWPTGLIRRVQVQTAHEQFMQNFPGRDSVMLKITDVETLLRKGEVSSTYFPDSFTVISSGVLHDDELLDLRWSREGYAADAFAADYHIPTDYPVYGNMAIEDRIANIEKMMEGTRWMHQHLANSKPQTLPLVKGFTPEERSICYETLRELGTPYCAYYGAQYFGGEMGNGISKLNKDVREVVSELDLDGLLLIGLLSENGLEKMPPEVVAAAGKNQWIKRSGLRDLPVNESQQKYIDWREEAEAALSEGDSTLGSFSDSSEVMLHG